MLPENIKPGYYHFPHFYPFLTGYVLGKFTHLIHGKKWVKVFISCYINGLNGWKVGFYALGLGEYFSIVCLEGFWGSVLVEVTGGR